MLSRAKPLLVALLAGVLVVGCGDSVSVGTESVAPTTSVSSLQSLQSLAAWCATYDEKLPALSSPNPDGQELVVLDTYITRYSVLATGAPGVSESAKEEIAKFAAAVAVIRDRVVRGERLAAVLEETYPIELMPLARTITSEVATLCS